MDEGKTGTTRYPDGQQRHIPGDICSESKMMLSETFCIHPTPGRLDT